MLLFTPELEQTLEVFHLTYQVTGGYGWAMWQRAALPCDGGLIDQPAKLMMSLALIARVMNADVVQKARRSTRRQDAQRSNERRG